MNDAARLLRLFEYDRWASLKILAVLEEHSGSGFERREKVLGLLGHLIAAQDFWHRRVTGGDLSGIEVWPVYDLEECRSHVESNHEKWKALIEERQGDLDRVISYKTTSGTPHDTVLSDIMHHLIIHGQHHRAQIAMLFRMAGIAPPQTGFIFYTREDSG